jgi:hypothetical protein
MEADTSTLSNGTFEGRTGAFRAMLRRFPLSILWLIVLDGPEFSVRETEEQAQRHGYSAFSKRRTSPPSLNSRAILLSEYELLVLRGTCSPF